MQIDSKLTRLMSLAHRVLNNSSEQECDCSILSSFAANAVLRILMNLEHA